MMCEDFVDEELSIWAWSKQFSSATWSTAPPTPRKTSSASRVRYVAAVDEAGLHTWLGKLSVNSLRGDTSQKMEDIHSTAE